MSQSRHITKLDIAAVHLELRPSHGLQEAADECLARPAGGEARPEGLQHQRVIPHRGFEVGEGDPTVLVVVHLLEGHLDEVLDALVPVLLEPLPDEAGLQHGEHLFSADEAVSVQIVDVEAVFYLLVHCACRHAHSGKDEQVCLTLG